MPRNTARPPKTNRVSGSKSTAKPPSLTAKATPQRRARPQSRDLREAPGRRHGWAPPREGNAAKLGYQQARPRVHNPSRVVGIHEAQRIISTSVPGLRHQPVKKILASFLDPIHHRPVRLPDVGSATCLGTAVATLCVTDTVSWDEISTSDLPDLFKGAIAAGTPIIDDPSNRLVVSFRDPVVLGAYMSAGWPRLDPTRMYSTVWGVACAIQPKAGQAPVPLTLFEYDYGPKRYGAYHPPGIVAGGEQQIFWVDANSSSPANLTIDLAGVCACASATLVCEASYWLDEHESHVVATSTKRVLQGEGLPSFDFSLNWAGYVGVTLSIVNDAAGQPGIVASYTSITVGIVTTCPTVFQHVLHPSFVDIIARSSLSTKEIMTAVRVLGNTLLVSNTTAAFFKAGTVYAKQKDGFEPWYADVAAPDDFTGSNVATSYDGPLSKGLYAVVKPQGEGSLDLKEIVNSTNGTTTETQLCFAPFRMPGVVVSLLSPGPRDPAAPPSTVVLHWFRGIEFATQNQLFAVEPSDLHRVDLLNFLDEISHARQFYENPLHLKDIAAALQSAGRFAWKNKTTIAEIASLLAKMLL